MAQGLSEVLAEAEIDIELLMVPVRFIDSWMDEFPCEKKFIMSTKGNRFEDFLQNLDPLPFQRMDDRHLQDLRVKYITQKSNNLEGTHQKNVEEIH